VTGRIELLDSAGTIVHTMNVPGVPATAAGLDVTLGLAGLAPGAYTVRVTAADGKATLDRSTGINIR
jgi:hypothetical protein